MVHIYNGILLSRGKEHIWVSFNEVDEPRIQVDEPGIQSEVSQKEKNNYCLLMHIYGI